METSISLIRDLMGNPIGFRGIGRDVTDKHMARMDLRRSEYKYRTILHAIRRGITRSI